LRIQKSIHRLQSILHWRSCHLIPPSSCRGKLEQTGKKASKQAGKQAGKESKARKQAGKEAGLQVGMKREELEIRSPGVT